MKYHITPDGPKACDVKVRACKYTKEGGHYISSAEADAVYYEKMSNEHGVTKQLSSSRSNRAAVTDIASSMHDGWREGRRKADGTFEPRMKDDGKGGQVDIANTDYKNLPKKWQAENKASAESAIAAVQAHDNVDSAASQIHDDWLSRNGDWAPDEQKLPYSELSEVEKEKDRVVARAAAARMGIELLEEKNGVMVVPGKIVVGGFLRQVVEKNEGKNSRFTGSFEDLARIVSENFENHEPGTGSVDGDVVLVNVPPEGFHSTVVEITDENRHMLIEENVARVEGEAPVMKKLLLGVEPAPANFVKIVCYRADTLAKDDNRTSDAEFEIVAILSNLTEKVPMEPSTMKRNSNREVGGTYREYTPEQWAESEEFWSRHAHIKSLPTE